MTAVNSAAAGQKTQQKVSQSQKSQQILSKDMKTFLNLLTTQLKNQDPTSPMDTNKFTQQLTQFSGIEQQIRTNKHLEKLVGLQGSNRKLRALDYMGATIEAAGHTNMLGKKGKAEWIYALPGKAKKVTIEVRDQKNNVVYTENRVNQSGRNEFSWDGKSSKGKRMPEGAYTIVVKAVDDKGKAMKYTAGIRGKVDSIDFVKDKVYARIGKVTVDLDNIINVKRPNAATPAKSKSS